MIRFTVYGVPQPKGSTKAFVPKGWTRAIVTSTTKGLKGWEQQIAAAANAVASGVLLEGPLNVTIDFRLPRPTSLPKRVRQHTRRPDLDKIVRGACDALTQVIWKDDSQIVVLSVTKKYCIGAETPCALFQIVPLRQDGSPEVQERQVG